MGAVASRTLSVAGPTDLSDVIFRIVDQTRYTEVLDLLYANFHNDEPISRALNIFDGKHRIPEADEYTLKALKENLSIMAVDSITNKLLGVSVNGICTREGIDYYPLIRLLHSLVKYSQVSNIAAKKGMKFPKLVKTKENMIHRATNKFRHIMTIMADLHDKAGDIFTELETDIIFDIKMVATDKLNRRCGLGTDLLRRSVQLAQSLGYKAIKTEATGLYSRKAFERLGFTVAAEFLYEDYEVNGEKVLEKIKNHRGTVFMIKRLSEVQVTQPVDV